VTVPLMLPLPPWAQSLPLGISKNGISRNKSFRISPPSKKHSPCLVFNHETHDSRTTESAESLVFPTLNVASSTLISEKALLMIRLLSLPL
jgi:hypothetical protein